MLKRIAIAIVIGIAVSLVCIGLGMLLIAIGVQPLPALGAFLKNYAGLIGLLAGIYNFLTGRPSF